MLIVPTEKRFDWQHAPIILFLLVLANCLVYFLYQSGDNQKIAQAFAAYDQSNYIELEWPQFQDFLSEHQEDDALREYRALHSEKHYDALVYGMLSREDFYEYLRDHRHDFLAYDDVDSWLSKRKTIHDLMQSTSSLRFGLQPNKLGWGGSLLSHQFLHGDAMHLLGNMFFLIICGFAVEAAIGHLRFLAFYLLSGVGGGLLYSVIDLSSSTSLVGASGAISGVMAMYVAAFRFRKIEFFYWFFIFVGYVRAPAVLILVFYIGKELLDFYTQTGSNIAYMAHVGGFVAGALLIGGALLFQPDIFNEDYIEEDQGVDPEREKLAAVYALVEKYRFNAALKLLNELIAERGSNFDLEKLRYDLMRPRKPAGYAACVASLLAMRPTTDREIATLGEVWCANPDQQAQLADDDQLKLAMFLTTPLHIQTAESIFQRLQDKLGAHSSLGVLARKLSVCFELLGDRAKQAEYAQIADAQVMGARG